MNNTRTAMPKLNPNSTYHSILIKEYGYEGAIKVLRASSFAYSVDMVSQLHLKQAKPMHPWRR